MIGLVVALVLASWQKPEIDPRASRLPPGIHPKFYQPGSHLDAQDPLLLIQVANELISQGEKRALDFFKDWDNTDDTDNFRGDVYWANWLTRILFVGKRPNYVFPPFLDDVPEAVKENPQKWPIYPIIFQDSAMVLFPYRYIRGGQLPRFGDYLKANSQDWRIRYSKYILPDDPFLTLPKLMVPGASPEDAETTQEAVVSQIFKLVRTAYRPANPSQRRKAEYDLKTVEVLHQEFLKAGCHWDRKLSLYVRKDGSFDKDPIEEFITYEYKFPPLKNLRVVLNFNHRDRAICEYSADVSETYGSKVPTAVLEAIDPKTKKQLDWIHINSPSFVLPADTTIEKMLAEPSHIAVPELRRTPSTMKLIVDDKVQFVLHYDGKTYTTPELNP